LLWTDEFSRYTFIWLSYLSAAIVFREHDHISIDILYAALPGKVQKVIDKFNSFLHLAFFIFILGVATKIIPVVMKQITPTLGIKMGYVYLAFPISAVIMLLNLITQEFFGEKNQLKGANN
jgi:C4-dicarboxylate transporter DctQ subunit